MGPRKSGAERRSLFSALAIVAALLLLLLARLAPPSTLLIRKLSETTTLSLLPAVKYGSLPVLTRDLYVSGHEKPHAELCPSLGAKLRLLILVTSAPSHLAARYNVRKTWGHFAHRSDIALAFFIGFPPKPVRNIVSYLSVIEDFIYGDIIVGRFMDSYSNLTLKTLSMLEWVDTYCPRVQRMLKTDDDVFINVPRLLEFIIAPSRVNATKSIWGRVMVKNTPRRRTRDKYFVSQLQFPGKVFPDFTSGPAYLLTTDVIRSILAAATSEPYLSLEDVFITGVLGNKLGIKRRHAREFYNRKVRNPCAVQRGISFHMVKFHVRLYKKLLDGKLKCATSLNSVRKGLKVVKRSSRPVQNQEKLKTKLLS